LQEWAKLLRNVPPQYSPFAFSSSTPSMVAAVSTGNSIPELATGAAAAGAGAAEAAVFSGGFSGAEQAERIPTHTNAARRAFMKSFSGKIGEAADCGNASSRREAHIGH